MKRPVAAKQPAVAAVNDPQAKPNQPRRPINGDVSSGTFAFFLATGLFTAAALVVFPASAGFIGGGGAGFGFTGGVSALAGPLAGSDRGF
tara:strand:- start:575 stop:844 length:270 start_codon:yes stop_codon:yes gene_type:complete